MTAKGLWVRTKAVLSRVVEGIEFVRRAVAKQEAQCQVIDQLMGGLVVGERNGYRCSERRGFGEMDCPVGPSQGGVEKLEMVVEALLVAAGALVVLKRVAEPMGAAGVKLEVAKPSVEEPAVCNTRWWFCPFLPSPEAEYAHP